MLDVDLVVAVHDLRRNFVRAVRSAFDDDGARPGGSTSSRPPSSASRPKVRVTVVAHGIPASEIEARLRLERLSGELADGRVRVLELDDGVPSPTGPFTLGLDSATATFVALLGSDDHLAPGALAAWWRLAESRGSAAVLAPMRLDSGRLLRNPVPRPFAGRFWPAPLDPVRDRLAPRSAPLGLVRREVVERLRLRLTPGLRTGEDIAFSARLWFSGERLDLDRRAPAYVIGTDAAQRVSTSPKAVQDELAALRLLREEPWVEALGPAQRRALAVTVLRVHVLGAVGRRAGFELPEDEGDWLSALARDWVELAPAALDPLSRADRMVLASLLEKKVPLSLTSAYRANADRPDAILPQRVRHLLDREGTLRRYVRERMWW